jgi:hypothetical protein
MLHFHGRRWNQRESKQSSVCFHADFFHGVFFDLEIWRWRRYVPPKRRLTINGLHGVISQKIVLLNLYITCQRCFCSKELCTVEWDEKTIMICEWDGLVYLKTLSQHSHLETVENYESFQWRWLVAWPRYQTDTFRIKLLERYRCNNLVTVLRGKQTWGPMRSQRRTLQFCHR